MKKNELLAQFQSILKDKSYPCLIDVGSKTENILSATALWNLSLHRRHEMRKAGMKPGDLWLQEESGHSVLINFFACLHGDFLFSLRTRNALDPRESDKVRLWRMNHDAKIGNDGETTVPHPMHGAAEFSLILQTSGTSSGKPRTVRLSGSQIALQLENHLKTMTIEPESCRLLILPWFHSFGFILDLLLGLFARQYLFRMQDVFMHPRQIYDCITRYEIEWLAAVPRIVELLHQYSEKNPGYPAVLSKLNIHSGGAYIPKETQAKIKACVKTFYWGYGLTECGPGVLLNGQAMGCELRLRQREDSALKDLLVKSKTMGNWVGQDDDLDDGWLETGDVAVEDNFGVPEVLGRSLDCFKSTNGTWVSLRNLESSLAHELDLAAVHIALGESAQFFAIKVLSKSNHTETMASPLIHTLRKKLDRALPLPSKIWLSCFSTQLWENLTSSPQKSMSETLKKLSLSHFMLMPPEN